jgi:hypothetical protein
MPEHFAEIIDRHGRRRRAKKGDVLADGEKFTVSMQFMDSQLHDELVAKHGGGAIRVVDVAGRLAGHRPGFVFDHAHTKLVDAAQRAYDERSKRMADAWRTDKDKPQHDGRVASCECPQLSLDEARALADSAREARDERLRNAWGTR